MTDDESTVKRGWRFPEGVEPPDDEDWYRFPMGGSEVHGFSWAAHVHLLHETGDFGGIETEVVDSGFSPDGIQYAGVKATVIIGDRRFSSLQGADQTSNQVRDPEYVFAVAESRALKRAVKKALDIKPADEDTTRAADEEAGYDEYGHPIDDGPDEPDVETEPEPTPDPPTPPAEAAGDDDLDW